MRYTSTALQEPGKEHHSLINAKLQNRREDKTRKNYAENMAVVIKRLWVRRTGDSNFMRYDLIMILVTYHFDYLFKYLYRHKTLLKGEMNLVDSLIRLS